MSLRNFHVDSNVTDSDLLKRSDGLFKNFVASFRQAAANGHFSFGGITLQDHDLNRVHGIVTEIDSRRLFYACGEDESPHYAMQSLYEARRSIVNASKGVWANPSCEVLVQEITATLSQHCTAAEKLAAKGGDMWSCRPYGVHDGHDRHALKHLDPCGSPATQTGLNHPTKKPSYRHCPLGQRG